jgi:hypothetical protein
MSPEQARGRRDLDIRTDIYALGSSLYHMLVGQVPFSGRTATEVMRKHLSAPLSFPVEAGRRLPVDVRELIGAMMAKDRDQRIPDYGTLIEEVGSLMIERSVTSPDRRATFRRRLQRESRTGTMILVVHPAGEEESSREGEWIAEGLRAEGVEALVREIEEVVPEDLFEADGLVLGAMVHRGRVATEATTLLESPLVERGALHEKIGVGFVAGDARDSDRRRAQFDLLEPMIRHGMLVRGEYNAEPHPVDGVDGRRRARYELGRRVGRQALRTSGATELSDPSSRE